MCERCLWCELLSVPHTHTPTQTHTHSPPRSPAGKGWVRSNRNPRDLKMTDEQRQVETASSPSQIIRRWQQSLMSNSGGTIITRAHYHNKPSTPTHILTHERLVSTSPAGSGRTVGVDDVPECCFHHQHPHCHYCQCRKSCSQWYLPVEREESRRL